MDEYYSNGKLKIRNIDSGNFFTLEIYYNNELNTIKEQTFFNGDDIELYKKYYESGGIKNVEHYKHGEYHSDNDLPSMIHYYENGSIRMNIWHLNGKKHRENLPAEEYFNESGNIVYIAYYHNDKLHRDGSFAEWKFDADIIYDELYNTNEDDVYDEIDNSEVISEYNWYNLGVKYKGETYQNGRKISESITNESYHITTEYENNLICAFTCRSIDDKYVYYEEYQDGIIYMKSTIDNDYSYREYFDENSILNCKQWYFNKELYRIDDLPTIEKYKNGILIRKEWRYNLGYFRKDDLPVIECYNGNIMTQRVWFDVNKIHRNNDLPAIERCDNSGNVIKKEWYKNGMRHRDTGFAVEYMNGDNGEIWIHGRRKINFNEYIGNESCSICYELKEKMIFTKCNHIFCKSCVDSWCNTGSDICPYCRQKM